MDVRKKLSSGDIVFCTSRLNVHDARAVDGLAALFRVIDLIVVDLDLFDLLGLDFAHERAVVDLLDTAAVQQRRHEQIEQRNDQKHDAVVIQQGLFR